MKKGIIMINFEKLSRTLMARGIIFSRDDMNRFGVKKIFNSTGIIGDLGSIKFFYDIERDNINSGVILVESRMECCVDGRQKVTSSIIYFDDYINKVKFCIGSGDIYKGEVIYLQLSN